MLVEGVEAADATIVEHDGLLFMFAVVRDGVGGYSDTLAIWSSADLLGPWQPHPAEPRAGRRPHRAACREFRAAGTARSIVPCRTAATPMAARSAS